MCFFAVLATGSIRYVHIWTFNRSSKHCFALFIYFLKANPAFFKYKLVTSGEMAVNKSFFF